MRDDQAFALLFVVSHKQWSGYFYRTIDRTFCVRGRKKNKILDDEVRLLLLSVAQTHDSTLKVVFRSVSVASGNELHHVSSTWKRASHLVQRSRIKFLRFSLCLLKILWWFQKCVAFNLTSNGVRFYCIDCFFLIRKGRLWLVFSFVARFTISKSSIAPFQQQTDLKLVSVHFSSGIKFDTRPHSRAKIV